MGHGQHEHGHDGHEHDEHGAGTWRDPAADDRLSVSRRRFLAGASALAAGVAVTAGSGEAAAAQGPSAPVNPWTPGQRFLAGDHHIHTQFSPDAQYEIETQVAQAARYGLSWVVMTDHGGTAHQKFSIGQITPRIEQSRRRHRDLLVYQGLEWNIPGAEHATVFLPPGPRTVEVLTAFEAGFDGSILADQKRVARATSADGEPFALEGLRYLDRQVLSGATPIALMFANHPARRGVDSPHELRGWRDAAPRVAVGMEGAPGHQAAGIPTAAGGPGQGRGFYEAAPGPDSFPGYAPTPTENPYRTYGGFDWMTAKVGGVWDSLLAEGKPWWVTSTSDSHQVWRDSRRPGTQDYATTGSRGAPSDTGAPITTYGDFWPGQYSATLVGAASRDYLEVMRGLQAGRVVAVHGRLIDGLDVRVSSLFGGDPRGVTLGGRTTVRRGSDVTVDIVVVPALGPNASGQVPRLAKVDLIAGPVTGPAVDRDALAAPRTTVVRTFETGRLPGPRLFRHTFPRVGESFYLRLRGSDGRRLAPDGGPVMDVPGNADPFADLWFHANPVFVDVR